MWQDLLTAKSGFGGNLWCVDRDFNAVKSRGERKGMSSQVAMSKCEEFQKFIEDMLLVDVSMLVRKFTWFKEDRSTMSRLDRFLVSKELISL